MERIYTNTQCPLYGTDYCQRLNMVKCEVCPANDSKSRAEQVREDLDAIAALLPEPDISALFHTDSCVLCKSDPKPRAFYAIADIGNSEPEREGRNFLGMKVKLKTGSLFPAQLSCCKDCRHKHQVMIYLPILLPLGVAVGMLLLLGAVSIREGFAALHPLAPVAALVLAVGGSMILARVLEVTLRKRYEKETYLNIMEQPFLARMAERGWFEIQRGKRTSQVIFAKERLKQGLYTR